MRRTSRKVITKDCLRVQVDTSIGITKKPCASALPDSETPRNSLGILIVRLQLSAVHRLPVHAEIYSEYGINLVKGPEKQSLGILSLKSEELISV